MLVKIVVFLIGIFVSYVHQLFQILCFVVWKLSCCSVQKCGLWLFFAFLPFVSASSSQTSFPNIPFRVFSDFVTHEFDSNISLTTVLTVLFTLTSNTDLLNLHARQQHPRVQGEIAQRCSGWMKALARILEKRLGQDINSLSTGSDTFQTSDESTTAIGIKLDSLSKLLGLTPYSTEGVFLGKLRQVSEQDIQPVQIICPTSMECETIKCKSHALHIQTRNRDISSCKLVKGIQIYNNVPVLSGHCPVCQTGYYADHEHAKKEDGTWTKLYLTSARYLRVGHSIWVDRIFSGMVLEASYQFHASTSAFAEFWNQSFWTYQKTLSRKISRRQIWQAFIQESIRKIAAESRFDLELPDGLNIHEVTRHAFKILGEHGVIQSAANHVCSECTHEYKATADIIEENSDPAGLVGVDENCSVPAFAGGNDNLIPVEEEVVASDDRADEGSSDQEKSSENDSMDVDEESSIEHPPVQMIVLDGIVMGHKYCAMDGCFGELANYHSGVFCQLHEHALKLLCHIQGCQNHKVVGTKTFIEHQNQWHAHVICFGRSSMLGIRRLLRRSEEEAQPWLPTVSRRVQPHDAGHIGRAPSANYFTAPHFYCVETICVPCGVVIAWAKFARAESPTNILNFLDQVYPTTESRPDYVCIDKACLVLRHAIASGRWNSWKETTRFIVDSYHYINHRTTDSLCRKFCNPAPLDGSAPNLVAVEKDKHGRPHYKRAFNTQTCEQLNAWLGGYEPIISRMTAVNFDWFIHTMLFIHTQKVVLKKVQMESADEQIDAEDDEDSDNNEDVV
jgi:hypothetical protein